MATAVVILLTFGSIGGFLIDLDLRNNRLVPQNGSGHGEDPEPPRCLRHDRQRPPPHADHPYPQNRPFPATADNGQDLPNPDREA